MYKNVRIITRVQKKFLHLKSRLDVTSNEETLVNNLSEKIVDELLITGGNYPRSLFRYGCSRGFITRFIEMWNSDDNFPGKLCMYTYDTGCAFLSWGQNQEDLDRLESLR